jgi:hypothetical protein
MGTSFPTYQRHRPLLIGSFIDRLGAHIPTLTGETVLRLMGSQTDLAAESQ